MGFVGLLNLNNLNETVQMEQTKWECSKIATTKYSINETLYLLNMKKRINKRIKKTFGNLFLSDDLLLNINNLIKNKVLF